MMRDHYDVIRRPLVTEKNMHRSEVRNQYTFEVAPRANKVEIRQAVEALFKVRVTDVNTIAVRGKTKRSGMNFHMAGKMKKAVVTLHTDDKIELL